MRNKNKKIMKSRSKAQCESGDILKHVGEEQAIIGSLGERQATPIRAIEIYHRPENLLFIISPRQAEELKRNSPDRCMDIYTLEEYRSKYGRTDMHDDDPVEDNAIRVNINYWVDIMSRFPSKDDIERTSHSDPDFIKKVNNARFIVREDDDIVIVEPM